MFCGGFGEGEGPPVCVAADYAAWAENLDAGIFGDSIEAKVRLVLLKSSSR